MFQSTDVNAFGQPMSAPNATNTPNAPAVLTAPNPSQAVDAGSEDLSIQITVGEETFDVVKAPPLLMISELALIDAGDPSAIGTLAEFFKFTLADQYSDFKRAIYARSTGDPDADTMQLTEYVRQISEAAYNRP